MNSMIYRVGVQHIDPILEKWGKENIVELIQKFRGKRRDKDKYGFIRRRCRSTEAWLNSIDGALVHVSRMDSPAIGWDPFTLEGVPEGEDRYLRNVRYTIGVYNPTSFSRDICYAFKGNEGYIIEEKLKELEGRKMTERDLESLVDILAHSTPRNL